MELNIKNEIMDFIDQIREENIYNEYSLQFELGWFLRSRLDNYYTIQVEKKISASKTEENVESDQEQKVLQKTRMDIFIENSKTGKRFAIELKFSRAGQVPYQMYQFVKDIRFLEELKEKYGFSRGYSIVLVDSTRFYEGKELTKPIYKYFRTNKFLPKCTPIAIPVGRRKGCGKFSLTRDYPIEWKTIRGDWKYYIVEV